MHGVYQPYVRVSSLPESDTWLHGGVTAFSDPYRGSGCGDEYVLSCMTRPDGKVVAAGDLLLWDLPSFTVQPLCLRQVT